MRFRWRSWRDQGSEHNESILIGCIVLSDRTRDDAEDPEAELFPQASRDLVLGKHEVEDHAAIAELLGIVEHHSPKQPAQPAIPPLRRHDESCIRHVARAPGPVGFEVEGAE